MANIVRGVVIEVSTIDTQDNLDEQLLTLEIPADDFLAATTISLEEKNNKAKVLILYSVVWN